MKNPPARIATAKGRLFPWLAGIGIATLFFAGMLLFTSFHYIGNDDAPILRSFMGYEGGVPASFHLYVHTVLAWFLHGLAVLFPGVAWFSLLQLFFLWFSCVVIVKSASAAAANHGLPLWAGAAAGTVFLLVYASFVICRITYTTTGALLGAAAVAQLLGVDYQSQNRPRMLPGMLLSIALLLCCYSLRQINVLPPLAFWLLGMLFIRLMYFTSGKQAAQESAQGEPAASSAPSAKPLGIALLVCALSFGLFAGVRAVEIKALQLEDYLQWQNARIQLLDYTDFYDQPRPELLKELGWSEAEFKLIANWFFMDRNITAQAFQTFYEALPEASLSPADKLSAAPAIIQGFFRDHPAQAAACALAAALALLCAMAQCWKRPKGLWLWLAPLGGLLLGAALMGYLAYQGRMPLRAAAGAIFPTSAFLLCLSFACLRPPERPRKGYAIFLAFLCVVCLALAGQSATHTARLLFAPVDPEELARASITADLDEYALENPDMLIIYDLSLAGDRRLFPDTSRGIPPNLMFWGGWPARSPSWNRQLEAYGLDPSALTSRDFLRDNVLVAGTDGQPWESLMAYVAEGADGEVDWDFYGEYGYIYFYQLYEY